jgi:hypothetical protein
MLPATIRTGRLQEACVSFACNALVRCARFYNIELILLPRSHRSWQHAVIKSCSLASVGAAYFSLLHLQRSLVMTSRLSHLLPMHGVQLTCFTP